MAKLKKGSAEAKAWGAKMKRVRAKPKKSKSRTSPKRRTSTKRKTNTMAKRKTVKRRKSNSMKIFGINTSRALAAGLYGAGREKLSNMLSPYVSKLPLGNVADEAGMYLAAWAGKKFLFKQKGIIRDALSIGQDIEMARIGEAVATGSLGLPKFGGAATQSTGYFS